MSLSDGERRRALELARGAQARMTSRAAATRARKARRFSDLADYRKIETLRAFSEMTGIESPFFRTHEGRSGARAVIDGREVLNYASYDYLGLNGHPAVLAAAHEAIDRYGVSPSASRPTAGERPIHAALETALAAIYGVEAALTFVSGHATNVSTIATLVGPKDLVISDQLAHNSIVVGAEASGAARRIFPHNDLDALEQVLSEARDSYENVLIVVEGVYSMDGDYPDLPGLIALKEAYGAWLMVDEAHALGVLGARGLGLAEHFGVAADQVDVWMGTLGKTLASCGGYIAGSAALIDLLRYHAPGFVYSVALPPVIAAAALAALEAMRAEPKRVTRAQTVGARLLSGFRAAGIDVGASQGAAVIPAMTGGSLAAVRLADRLLAGGVNAFPIFHPAVPEQSARVRFFVTSEHSDEDIDHTVALTAEAMAAAFG